MSTARTISAAFSAVAAVGQEHLYLEGPVLDGGCQVLDRHQGQRRETELSATGVSGARRVAELEPGDRGEPDQAPYRKSV